MGSPASSNNTISLAVATHRGLFLGPTCCPISAMFNALRAGIELSFVAVASMLFALAGLCLVCSRSNYIAFFLTPRLRASLRVSTRRTLRTSGRAPHLLGSSRRLGCLVTATRSRLPLGSSTVDDTRRPPHNGLKSSSAQGAPMSHVHPPPLQCTTSKTSPAARPRGAVLHQSAAGRCPASQIRPCPRSTPLWTSWRRGRLPSQCPLGIRFGSRRAPSPLTPLRLRSILRSPAVGCSARFVNIIIIVSTVFHLVSCLSDAPARSS